jgi:hypothetical protein
MAYTHAWIYMCTLRPGMHMFTRMFYMCDVLGSYAHACAGVKHHHVHIHVHM